MSEDIKQETLSDIAALFRTYAKATRDVKVKTMGFGVEYLDEIADRIDAAREREGENMKKLCMAASDMDRFLGRHQPTDFLWDSTEPKKGPKELWEEFNEIGCRLESALVACGMLETGAK